MLSPGPSPTTPPSPARRAALLERALGYPYAIPAASFVQRGEETLDLEAVDIDLDGRMPLLAYGSNAAPEALARKLGAASLADPVAVLRARLAGFDVVYSAHVSIYGSIPAALMRSPGTTVEAFVAYLSEAQLELLTRTEPNYELIAIEAPGCRLDDGSSLDRLALYRSRHGCLVFDGAPVALGAIPATGRATPSMTQPEVQERVRQALSPQTGLEEFVLAAALEPEVARLRTDALKEATAPPQISTPGEIPTAHLDE